MRKLVSVQRIKSIEPIEGADRIELAQVLGWQCVVQKGIHSEGELIVFFEIDSFLPIAPEYEFLRKSCYKQFPNGEEGFRLKTMRFKGQISQGLIMPLSILSGKNYPNDDRENPEYEWTEEKDVTTLLNVKKYDPPIPAHLQGIVKGQFPSFIPKTDETRCQVLQEILTRYKGTECYLSEKIDGSSTTYFFRDGYFGVCSRNLELADSEGNAQWKLAKELKIKDGLEKLGRNLALQGEIFGFGIQGNPLKIKDVRVRFYQVFDIDKAKYLDFDDFRKVVADLGLETVPVIETSFKLIDSIAALVDLSRGYSVINASCLREGVVIRPKIEVLDIIMGKQFGSNGRVSFKSINPDYLIKQG